LDPLAELDRSRSHTTVMTREPTTAQRHARQDHALLASRHELYQQARQANP
jgi:hypothetical protein